MMSTSGTMTGALSDELVVECFGPGTFDPNVGAAVVGQSGEVCFANSVHGDVDLVADPQLLLNPTTFTATASPVRQVDTRVGLGGSRLAPNETRCFAVEGTPGDVVFVNLTPVLASAPGFGVLRSSPPSTPTPGSSVNFGPGRSTRMWLPLASATQAACASSTAT